MLENANFAIISVAAYQNPFAIENCSHISVIGRWTQTFRAGILKRLQESRRQPSDLAPVAQMDRVPPSEGGGHRFESCRARHLKQRFKADFGFTGSAFSLSRLHTGTQGEPATSKPETESSSPRGKARLEGYQTPPDCRPGEEPLEDKKTAAFLLDDWIKRPAVSGIQMLKQLANALAAYRLGILAYYDFDRLCTGPIEGARMCAVIE